MHTLSRQVRFSITPFLPAQPDGFNTYASKPSGEGLSFYLALWVELVGSPDPETGFIVNVSQIDAEVRTHIIPLFTHEINASLDTRKPLSLPDLAAILHGCTPTLCRIFSQKHRKTLKRLSLELNPYRSICIDCDESDQSQVEDLPMFTYSEKFEFSAMHKLWNDSFSPEKNLEIFGKCANPAGHGHNYILEVAVQVPAPGAPNPSQKPVKQADNGWIAGFQEEVKTRFLDMVDHKNLNEDVPDFKLNPTVENIVRYAWQKLSGQFGKAKLSRLTVWENDRTYCTYSADV